LLVSHINKQYKPNQASSSGATFFATDKPSYSNKIGNISHNEGLSPSEKLKAITQETQNHINELAKDASGEKLSELIHALTGKLPEKDKINDILNMAEKAKEENQSLKIGNLRTKLWDFSGQLASEQKDEVAPSKSI